jgi:hypothetical protein
MKKKHFESICSTILPTLPGFACKGWLLYAHPVSHILRGFCCDISGFDPTSFTVWVFVLPLYVPTQHLYFNIGNRLKDERGCEKWWNLQEPDLASKLLSSIKGEGLGFLERVHHPAQIVRLVEGLPGNTNPHSLEAIAYSSAIADEYVAAQAALGRLVEALDVNVPWQAEMMERATQLGEKLNNDPQGAKQLLAQWEGITIRNLGL